MSSTIFSQENATTVQTRRTPTRNDDTETNTQRKNNHRSLSGKFRSLFQRNSASPTRATDNERTPSPAPPLPPARQRSPSVDPFPASTEAPHLRPPIIQWPFGKKKPKVTSETSSKTKTKTSRKMKKKPVPSIEISNPVHTEEYQTYIRGQNFVPRTPELAHGGTGRTQSSSSYETTTKGFRDYVIVDNSRSMGQLVGSDVDITTPPPYPLDHRRSPTFSRPPLPYANVGYSGRYDTSIPSPPPLPTISALEIIPGPPQQRQVNKTIQNLADQTPILPQTPVFPSPVTATIHKNQWKGTSSSTFNNSDLRPITTTPSVEVDIPKLHTPLIPLVTKSSKPESRRTDAHFRYDDIYTSSSHVNTSVPLTRPYNGTYSSLPDSEISHSDHSSSSKPFQSTFSTYPGLSAIIEHHIRPSAIYYNELPSTITTQHPEQTHRYEASTTTFSNHDQQPWSTNQTALTDGYIRPLTPVKPSFQSDVDIIHVNLDDLRSPPRTSHNTSSEIPITYRSSATIYTKDKQDFTNGGEIRTWSVRNSNDMNTNKKSSTSIFIERTRSDQPTKIATDYHYNPRVYEQEGSSFVERKEAKYQVAYEYEQQQQQHSSDTRYYLNSRYFDDVNDGRNSTLTRPLPISERDQYYDQPIHSYIGTGYTHEPLNSITPIETSDGSLRHYTLQRTDDYNGLGIVLTADTETRLNHRIRDIEPTSPGFRIGLRKNDRIVNVNGVNVENVEFGDVLILIKQGLTRNELQLSVINDAVLI